MKTEITEIEELEQVYELLYDTESGIEPETVNIWFEGDPLDLKLEFPADTSETIKEWAYKAIEEEFWFNFN